MPNLDRLSVGIPYKDKSNIGRYAQKDLKCGGNVWYINYDTVNKSEQKLHNDRYPLELATKCIKLSGIEYSIILDPFSGSGTTCAAAKRLGKNYLDIEINTTHYKTSIKRLDSILL